MPRAEPSRGGGAALAVAALHWVAAASLAVASAAAGAALWLG